MGQHGTGQEARPNPTHTEGSDGPAQWNISLRNPVASLRETGWGTAGALGKCCAVSKYVKRQVKGSNNSEQLWSDGVSRVGQAMC